MQITVIQHDIAWEDKAATHALVDELLTPAPAPGSLIVVPELFDTGFSMDVDAIADDRTVTWAQATARRVDSAILVGHAEHGPDGLGRNVATLVDREGSVLGGYRKVHPFSMGKEAAHYRGGHRLLLRRVEGAVVCPLVCYDLRFPELWRLAALHGAEVFLLIANWPAVRQAHWRSLVVARAIENQAFVVAVNRVGRDPAIEYVGGSMVVSPTGEILAEAGADPTRLEVTLDLEDLRSWRSAFPVLGDARRDLLGTLGLDFEEIRTR